MDIRLRQYRRAHGATRRPLPLIQAHHRKHGPPDAAAIRALADLTALPPSAVRGAASFYADLCEPAGGVRACRGTSCLLSGATPGGDGAAYCLGHCDRSPVALMPDGRVVSRSGDPVAPTDVRNLSREPIVTRRIGRGDFSDLADARADGAYRSLERALDVTPGAILDAVERSAERGRGGAGFPTGSKWRRCADAPGAERFVVANGDEGDPGSYIDRLLMERDPHAILEGLAICAIAVGAREGIVFVRSEYPAAIDRMRRAIDEATSAGILGDTLLGRPRALNVSVFPALGSFVCGEETAMLNAIEGYRGEVRLRPPYPTDEGLGGHPTVVNNVETLANIPWIIERGPEAYAALGTDASSGTIALCLNRGFARPGIVEVEFGATLRSVIEDAGGGGRGGDELEAVLLGGPMGSIVVPAQWDTSVCFGALRDRGLELGHGGVALPAGTDHRALLVHWLTFMRDESCGRCVPCRIGSQRALEAARGDAAAPIDELLPRLLDVMEHGSLCAFGTSIPRSLRGLFEHFGDRIAPGLGP